MTKLQVVRASTETAPAHEDNGVLIAGQPGSGKTTILARLFEQVGAGPVPLVVFDLEGDLMLLVPETRKVQP